MEPAVDFGHETDIFNTVLCNSLLFHSAWLFVLSKIRIIHALRNTTDKILKYHIWRTKTLCFLCVLLQMCLFKLTGRSILPHCHCPDYQKRPESLRQPPLTPLDLNKPESIITKLMDQAHHSIWYMQVTLFSITEHNAASRQQMEII